MPAKKPRTNKRSSDESVKAGTGKVWKEWFAILDRAGAKKWPHKEIARYLKEEEKVPSWWCQMVTVEYERARGLRQLYQKADGRFAASASRTLDAPLARVYQAWANELQRAEWLPKGKMDVTTARENKSIRAAWDGNKSRVNIGFYGKDASRCQVALDHEKLASAADRAKMKKYWHSAFARLEKHLEG